MISIDIGIDEQIPPKITKKKTLVNQSIYYTINMAFEISDKEWLFHKQF